MVVSHRYDFQRPSIKLTEEGVATMSGNIVSVDEESLKLCLVKPDFRFGTAAEILDRLGLGD